MSAARTDDVTLAELAAEVGMDEDVIAEDLKQVAERNDYLSSDMGADLQIILEDDRVYVWTKGEFSRPVRLSMREALALALGLRLARALPAGDAEDKRTVLRKRLEKRLASATSDEMLNAFEGLAPGEDQALVRETLQDAARDRRPCVIRYLKPGDHEPEERRIHPYALVHAEGQWYAIAHCENAGKVRYFRTDRALAARMEDGPFHGDETFDPADHMANGRILRGEGNVEALIRYSPDVARWVAESEEGEWMSDGSFMVGHRVADPGWIVRHVLHYGGEAEVVAPNECRSWVREAALALWKGGD